MFVWVALLFAYYVYIKKWWTMSWFRW